MKWLLLVVLLLMPTGCNTLAGSALGGLVGGGDGPSLEVDTDVDNADGDINNTNNVGSDTSNQQAETITNVAGLTIPQLILFCLLAGWAIPTPATMFIETARTTRLFFSILIRGK